MPIRVRAVMKNGLLGQYAGFYGSRIKAGQVFTLRSPDDFSDAGVMRATRWGWMEPADQESAEALIQHFRGKGVRLSFDEGKAQEVKHKKDAFPIK